MKKKHLGLIVRLLVAVAGLAYIAYMVDWTDKVQLSSGDYTLDAGQAIHLAKPQAFHIVSGKFDPEHLAGPVTAAVDSLAPGGRLTVEPQAFTAGDKYVLHPGLITTLRHANMVYLLIGLLLVAPIYPITAFRWWMLLHVRGITVPMWKAFKLSMVGCFFNYCMPGSTGGDFVKAYYAAKGTPRRADAVMTVIIDRVVGLLGLIFLAGIGGAFKHEDPRIFRVVLFSWALAGAIVLGSAFYFSKRMRRASGLEWLLNRFVPKDSLLEKIDRAAAAYSDHKLAVLSSILLSMPVHLLLAISASLAGWSLGMDTPFSTFITVVPILFLVAAIPISPQGVGTMEYLAIRLLAKPHVASPNQIVVMLVVIRLYQLLYSLTGSVFLLRGDIHMHPEREGEEDAGSPPQPVIQSSNQQARP